MSEKNTTRNELTIDAEEILKSVDIKRIQKAEKKLADARKKLASAEYRIQFENKSQFDTFFTFMREEAEWEQKEALGVIEICKLLEGVTKKDLEKNKDSILMRNLPLEASHYFVTKRRGRGLLEAEKFIRLLKPFEAALAIAGDEGKKIKALEQELKAAQQGIKLT